MVAVNKSIAKVVSLSPQNEAFYDKLMAQLSPDERKYINEIYTPREVVNIGIRYQRDVDDTVKRLKAFYANNNQDTATLMAKFREVI